jgi:hypothetical protein
MHTEGIVTEIEQLERIFSAPDTRPPKRERSCGRDLSRRFPESRKQVAFSWARYEAYLPRTRSIPEKSNSNL